MNQSKLQLYHHNHDNNHDNQQKLKYHNLFQELVETKPFFLIAGPCVIESYEHCFFMARELKKICTDLNCKLIFKSSFDKANRTSIHSYRGPGIKEGLKILAEIKEKLELPILTDVHEAWQCEEVAKVADIIQIPAFLCRQTDLLVAAGKTGKIIQVKKGQFCNHISIKNAYDKIISTGNHQVLLCDRGTMLGYDDLVVDFRNLVRMRDNENALIVQDITHALQQPNRGTQTMGQRELVPTIARAAVAVGIHGLFMEVHDDPENAKSDASTQWPLYALKPLLTELRLIGGLTNGLRTNYLSKN